VNTVNGLMIENQKSIKTAQNSRICWRKRQEKLPEIGYLNENYCSLLTDFDCFDTIKTVKGQ